MPNSKVDLNISAGTIFKIVSILVFVYLLYYFRDLVLVLLTSVVLASAIEPITAWFRGYKIPRVVAVIITYLVFFVIMFGIVFLFLPVVFEDFGQLLTVVPKAVKSLDVLDSLPEIPPQYFESLKDAVVGNFSTTNILPGIGNAIAGTSSGLVEAAQLLLSGVFNFVLIIVFSFYLAVQEDGVANFLSLVTYKDYENYIIDLWKRSRRKIGLWLQGQVFLGFLIGIFVYLGLSILGVKYALGLAILAAIFELIPIFGPILAAAPAIALGFAGGPALGFMVAGFYLIIQQFENHLIYPLVVKKIVGVPPLLVILALIVGAQIAGFWGIVLAVPLSAVLMELIGDIEKRKRFDPKV